jgi:hypothetical protein
MAAKRTPLDLTFEEHKEIAMMLKKLGKHLQLDTPESSKIREARVSVRTLLATLTGELDEFFNLDSKPSPDGTRPRVYYAGDPTGDMSHYSFLESRDDLEDIRQRIVSNKSTAKAVKCIDIMIFKMNIAGLY